MVLLGANSVEHNVFVFVYPIIIWDWDRIIGVDEGVSISRGRPWGGPDILVGAGMSGVVMMSYISSYGHIGGTSIACASPHSSLVWG